VDHDGAGWEELLRRVTARVNAAAAGDSAAVAGPEAVAEADALLDLLATDGVPHLRLQYAAGMLHWNRWAELGEAAAPSAQIAELLLTPLYYVDRSVLPPQLAELLDTQRPSDEAGVAYDAGRSLTAAAVMLGRPAFLTPAVAVLTTAVEQSTDDDPRRWAFRWTLGETLLHRHTAFEAREDLDRAAAELREASVRCPATGAEKVALLTTLGRALVQLAQCTEDPEPLHEAVDVTRQALHDAAPDDRDDVVEVAVGAVQAAAGRPPQDAAGARAILGDVVAAARGAVRASAPDDQLGPPRAVRLALALEAVGDPAALGEAVRLLYAAVPALDRADPLRAAGTATLGNRLLLDGDVPLDDEAFRLATTAAHELAAGSAPQDPDFAVCQATRLAALQASSVRGDHSADSRMDAVLQELSDTATTHRDLAHLLDSMPALRAIAARGERERGRGPRPIEDGDLELLDAAADVLRRSIAQEPVNRALLPKWLTDLARMLRQRCELRLGPSVDEAIAVHRRLLALLGPTADDELRVHLAALLTQLAVLSGNPTAAAEATTILEDLLAAENLDPDVRARARDLHADAIVEHAQASSDPAVAERAEAAMRAALVRGGPEALPALWHNLAILLTARHERTGEGLEEAIATARQAVAHGENAPEGQGERIAGLAQLLATAGRLDEAVTLARAATAHTPGAHPAAARNALGFVLRLHNVRYGSAGDLNEAIAALRSAVRATGSGTIRGGRLVNLAAALRARYSTSGDLATLDEAIATSRQALRELTDSHRQALLVRGNLVLQLTEHHRRTGSADSLAEAIAAGRHVVDATPPSHPGLVNRLGSLAIALTLEFRRTGARAALDEAIAAERRAVALTPPGHPERAMRLANLASSLAQLSDLTHRVRHAVEAFDVAKEAVALTPDDHPGRAQRLLTLAVAMANTGWPGRRRARRVAELLRAAADLPATPPSVRLKVYRAKGVHAVDMLDWETAAAAFAEGVRLLPRVAARNLTRADAEHQLADVDRLHADAAACALHAGDAAGALTVLEQGRGVLLSYALDTRTELTDLHAAAPDLAREVQDLVRELDQVDGPEQADDDPSVDEGEVLDRRHALAERWDAVLAQVRRLPGFDRFGAPPTVSDLLPAADLGPVVVINVSEYRCDALFVAPDGVRVVPLPGLTASAAAERAREFLDAIDLVGTGDLAQRMDGQAVVRTILAWLWDTVTEPVLDALGYTATIPDGAPWPRVWWSPTGMLNFLPLHAAGHHDRPGRCVLDRVVSSYTPTLRALLHGRSRAPAGDAALLAVAVSETPGHWPLPATVAEASTLVAGADRAVQLLDAAARYEAVLAALPRYGRVHFACHAVSDPLHPSESRLLLHDRALTVREISRLRLAQADLAFLAACSTARGSEHLADEAIHIASAFQLAGYRDVVATLWPTLDGTAARIAESFHAERRGASAAHALHRAVRELRAEQPLMPSAWACYVHAGP
jgi:tetratricopeptide (TPR) repeat protein